MITAKSCGIAVEQINAAKGDHEAGLIQRLNQIGMSLTYPVLETEEGDLITESPAICQFLAISGNKAALCGTTPMHQAQVDQWVTFLRSKTLPLAMALSGSVFGTVEVTPEEHAFITNELKENLKTLNNQLKSKQWFCGEDSATIADFLFAICLVDLQSCAMDTNLRNSLSNLNNHFKKLAAIPEIKG